MVWDEDKATYTPRDDVPDDEKLASDEWDAMVADQKSHSARHESGGVDEITVTGLSGDLADPQDPKQEAVEDFAAALVEGGTNVTTTYDDAAGTLTISASSGDNLTTENVQDIINDTLVGDAQVTTTYDDPNDTLTISIDAPTQAAFDDHSARHESGGVDTISVDGLSGDLADPQDPKQEAVEDFAAALIAGGTNVTTTYDDANGVFTIDATDTTLTTEEVQDTINETLAGDTQVTTTYDDAAGTLTISIDAPTQAEFVSHATRHESGGVDELDVAGLSGDLADPQDAKPHGGTHESGGVDELNVGGLSGVLADDQPPQADPVLDITLGNTRVVDPADGYAALQAALDDLGTTPGAVYIQPGEISDITDNVLVPSNTWLFGAGRDATTLKLDDNPSLSLAGTVRLDDDTSNVIISDLTIDGNRSNVADNGDEYCFYTSGATEWQLSRVRARNAPGYGIDPHDASGVPSQTFLISDCIAHNNGLDGIISAGNLRGSFVNCFSYNNDSSGFNVVEDPGDHVELYNCHAWNNDEGITIQKNMHDCAIIGGSAVNNTGAGIRLGSGGGEIEYCRVNGVRVANNGGYGINIRGSDSIAITNCIFRDNAQSSGNADISLQNTQSGTVHPTYISVANSAFEGVTQSYGIDERADAGPTTVVGNTFRGTYGTAAINLTNADSENVANLI